MKEFLPILQQCALFDGVRKEDLPVMLSCMGGRVIRCKKGQNILSEGDPANRVGILLEGRAHIIKEDYNGDRSVVACVMPSELFGESFACAGIESLPVDVVAETDCAYMLIDSRRMTTSCSNACAFHSKTIYNLLRIVSLRNLQYHQKMEITGKRTTRQKLMAYLLARAKEVGSNSFTIPYDRQALADYLQVERSAMSAEISKLRSDGILESNRNHFTLLDT